MKTTCNFGSFAEAVIKQLLWLESEMNCVIYIYITCITKNIYYMHNEEISRFLNKLSDNNLWSNGLLLLLLYCCFTSSINI